MMGSIQTLHGSPQFLSARREPGEAIALWKRSPVLYWTSLVWIVGLPNFLLFDPTGRTHDLGLFNATSLSRIGLFLLIAAIYIGVVLLTAGRTPTRKLHRSPLVWLSLLVWCGIASLLQPAGHLNASLPTDLPLSLFRLLEWLLSFCLFATLCRRMAEKDSLRLAVELIGRSSWIIIFMVWLALPLWPELVYGTSEDSLTNATFGGSFYNSGVLAVHAGFAFFYALLFIRPKAYAWLACAFSLLTLGMTRARTPLIGFLFALLCFAIFLSRNAIVRAATVMCVLFFSVIIFQTGQGLSRYILRGQSSDDLSTLDGRVSVWRASMAAISERPLLGYGYVVGARQAIQDHWAATHWLPPHAHNELLQAMLVGGLPCCALIIYLYLHIFLRCLKNRGQGHHEVLLLVAFLQLIFFAMIGVNLSVQYSSLGATFILCFLGTQTSVSDLKLTHKSTGNGRSEGFR